MIGNLTGQSKQVIQLDSILDLVRNEETYTARIKELKESETAANEASKKLTKAKNIDAALTSAQDKEQQAIDKLDTARREAIQIEKEARDKVTVAQIAMEELTEQKQEELQQAQDTLDRLKLTTNDLIQWGMKERQSIKDLSEQASKKLDEANFLKAQYEDKLQSLQAHLKTI